MDLAALNRYQADAQAELAQQQSLDALAVWHQAHLSRQGQLNQFKKAIGRLAPEARRDYGQAVNQVAQALSAAFSVKTQTIKDQALAAAIAAEQIDVTLPPRATRMGSYHPVTLVLREIIQIFGGMGFTVFESSHVETDAYSFQFLNIPKHHTARDMQDTFYISEDIVLRPHTSPGQIHAMRQCAPQPVQVILPGLCYRNEDITPRSEIQFHQVEMLLVGEHVRFSDLKGIILRFAQQAFGPEQAIKLRGSYFPFTEPSVEVDIKCTLCHGAGCRVCKHSGWLELLGAGMVHPTVLRAGGYDPSQVQGIAFGLGIERMAMLKSQIDDIRYFYQNDLRFLQQFV